jgi:hypothetical protein
MILAGGADELSKFPQRLFPARHLELKVLFFNYLSLIISVNGDCMPAAVSVDFAGFSPAKWLNPASQPVK